VIGGGRDLTRPSSSVVPDAADLGCTSRDTQFEIAVAIKLIAGVSEARDRATWQVAA